MLRPLSQQFYRLLTLCRLLVPFLLVSPHSAAGLRAEPPEAPLSKPEALTAVAIGDVHGDADAFFRLLRRAGLTDAEGHWSGGTLELIQTGDLVDRGPDSRRALRRMRKLQDEAREAGGRVVVLLGNHEVLNLLGDTKDVTAADFAAYLNDESPTLRATRRREILDLVARGSDLLRSDFYARLSRDLSAGSFDQRFPPGYFSQRAAFAPESDLGRWLISLPVLHRHGGDLFVHAGISPRFANWSPEKLDRLVHADLREWLERLSALEELGVFHRDLGLSELFALLDAEAAAGPADPKLKPHFEALGRLRQGLLFHDDGPLWYRGLALGKGAAFERQVHALLDRHGIERVIVGHTVTESRRVEVRLGERVLLIDTGMNHEWYEGAAGALFFRQGGVVECLELVPKKKR